MPAEQIRFLKIACCCPLLEGLLISCSYGATETFAASFLSDVYSNDVSWFGPLANGEFKLIDVPEMSYFVSAVDEKGVRRPKGELCIRGPHIFAGYLKVFVIARMKKRQGKPLTRRTGTTQGTLSK